MEQQQSNTSNEVLEDLELDTEAKEHPETVKSPTQVEFTPKISVDQEEDAVLGHTSTQFEQISLDDEDKERTSSTEVKQRSPTFGVFRNAAALFSSSSTGSQSPPSTSPRHETPPAPVSVEHLAAPSSPPARNGGPNNSGFFNVPLSPRPNNNVSSTDVPLSPPTSNGTEESVAAAAAAAVAATAPRSKSISDTTPTEGKNSAEDAANRARMFSWSGDTKKPSTLENVISQTRPTYLPPKPKEEDKKHMQQYQQMVKAAKQAELKKEQKDQKSKQERDKTYVDITQIWETEILPNWKSAMYESRTKEIIWNKGVPPRDRGRIWSLSIGNALACGRETYTIALDRARKAFSSSDGNAANIAQVIEADIDETLTSLSIFQKGGPYHEDLRDLLHAFTFYRTDIGYVRGINCIAAMLLVNMSSPEAFVCLVNLLNRRCLLAFCTDDRPAMQGYFRIFASMFTEQMSTLSKHFTDIRLQPSHFLPTWFITLFTHHLPLDVTARLLDIYFLEDDSILFRGAIACLRVLEARLYGDADEITEILEDEGELKWLDFGVDEKNFLSALKKSGEAWRLDSWERMCERELPETS